MYKKCKDISDLTILEFIKAQNGAWCTWGVSLGMPTVEDAMPDAPKNLQLAKMAQLIKRGLVDGCTCGCSGNFVIAPKGLVYLESKAVQK